MKRNKCLLPLVLFTLLFLTQSDTWVITDGIMDVHTHERYGDYQKKWHLEIIYAHYTKHIYYEFGAKWAIEEDYINIIRTIQYEKSKN